MAKEDDAPEGQEPSDAEFFAEALEKPSGEQPRTPDGKFAPKGEAEPAEAVIETAKPGAEPEKAAEVVKPEPVAATVVEPLTDVRIPHVPLPEHLQVRERAQAAERRAEAAEQRFQTLQRQLAQRERKPEPLPDPLQEPDAYANAIQSRVTQQFEARFINASLGAAHRANGKEFENAYVSFVDSNDDRLREQIRNADDPGHALMEWHRQQTALREIGGDLKSYQEKLRTETRETLMKDAEFRASIIAEMRAEAGGKPNGQARPSLVELPSLNRIPAAQRDVETDTDDATFFRSNLRLQR